MDEWMIAYKRQARRLARLFQGIEKRVLQEGEVNATTMDMMVVKHKLTQRGIDLLTHFLEQSDAITAETRPDASVWLIPRGRSMDAEKQEEGVYPPGGCIL